MTHEVLDQAPLAECARRLAAKIDNPAVSARFAKLAFEELRADPRNMRPAEADDMAGAPDWARRKHKRGEPLFVFAACRSSLARLRRVARQLQCTCAEAQHLEGLPRARLKPREAAMLDLMGAFIDKIERADFTTLDIKSRLFARERKARVDDVHAREVLCAKEEVFVAPGLAWRRVTSVLEMWAVGAEFRNCMARGSTNATAYARQLRGDVGRFFVLRDHSGKGLMVALAYPNQARIEDVRGPSNALIDPEHGCVRALAEAFGWRMSTLMLARPAPEHVRLARLALVAPRAPDNDAT